MAALAEGLEAADSVAATGAVDWGAVAKDSAGSGEAGWEAVMGVVEKEEAGLEAEKEAAPEAVTEAVKEAVDSEEAGWEAVDSEEAGREAATEAVDWAAVEKEVADSGAADSAAEKAAGSGAGGSAVVDWAGARVAAEEEVDSAEGGSAEVLVEVREGGSGAAEREAAMEAVDWVAVDKESVDLGEVDWVVAMEAADSAAVEKEVAGSEGGGSGGADWEAERGAVDSEAGDSVEVMEELAEAAPLEAPEETAAGRNDREKMEAGCRGVAVKVVADSEGADSEAG